MEFLDLINYIIIFFLKNNKYLYIYIEMTLELKMKFLAIHFKLQIKLET